MRSAPGRSRRPKRCSMWTDALGNPVSLEHAGSLGGPDDFVEGFIASEAGSRHPRPGPTAADVPYLQGMLAFAWEPSHLLEETEAAARRALAMRHTMPPKHHSRPRLRTFSVSLC